MFPLETPLGSHLYQQLLVVLFTFAFLTYSTSRACVSPVLITVQELRGCRKTK